VRAVARLSSKVAIVTGAASGIGKATAELFAREGALVVLVDLQSEAGASIAHSLCNDGLAATFLQADVTDAPSVQRVVEATAERSGRLDILVNNVGNVGEFAPTAECTEDNWDFLANLNAKSAFLGMKYALPVMARGGGGAIVNLASSAAMIGFPGRPAYSAAKGGIVALTRTVALEYAAHNIRVNCVCPGATLTPMLQKLEERYPGRHEFLRGQVPLKRLGQPEDVARAILFLASEEAAYITGVALPVDGGVTVA
jgi:NAD(P)-dependent dehydrogenase (short-subunit alcohol dehydrogenase family)